MMVMAMVMELNDDRHHDCHHHDVEPLTYDDEQCRVFARYPVDGNTWGGSWMYHMKEDNMLSIGYVVGLASSGFMATLGLPVPLSDYAYVCMDACMHACM